MGRLARLIGRILIPDELDAGPRAGSWRAERLESVETEHLFRDILITLTGAETGWRALMQAAEIARRENSVLSGLHIAPSEDDAAMAYGRQVLDEFAHRCQSLGVKYTTSLWLASGRANHRTLELVWISSLSINGACMANGRSVHWARFFRPWLLRRQGPFWLSWLGCDAYA